MILLVVITCGKWGAGGYCAGAELVVLAAVMDVLFTAREPVLYLFCGCQ
jgi:hypothetical protein